MRRAALVVLAVGATGCGSASADLFAIERTGVGAGAKLSLVVSDDGTVRCNGKAPVPLGAKRLLDGRALARDLDTQAALGLELPSGPAKDTTFRYTADLESGRIAFADSSRGIPPSYSKLAAYTRDVSRRVCKLRR